MKLEGYLKKSELTSKQRKALGNPDFEYDFARNRHAAMFFSLERVVKLENRDYQPAQLIKAESITSPFGYYQWTEKQLKQYCELALVEIDPEKPKFKTIKVYRTDILDQIEFTHEELKKAAENRTRKAQAKLLEQEQLHKLALLKQQKQDVIRSEWNKLTKLAHPCFELINEVQALAKDYRMRIVPSLNKQFEAKRIQEIANDILIPTAKKGPWTWKFKSMEQLELIIEEFYAIWNDECDECFINYAYLDDLTNQQLALRDRR
ncbi:MAG: hypothetical protein PUP93_26715 [Rhizonema sp. NSF051]|nr:hypothetical protein [Rhizonema sp. NSF051]